MPHAPNTNRWTPVPDQGTLDLLKAKQYTALAVWLCMLRDATLHQTWETSRSIATLCTETNLSRQTIVNAENYLVEKGYIRPLGGGGTSRKKVTFEITPIPNFGKPTELTEAKPSKPIGNW